MILQKEYLTHFQQGKTVSAAAETVAGLVEQPADKQLEEAVSADQEVPAAETAACPEPMEQIAAGVEQMKQKVSAAAADDDKEAVEATLQIQIKDNILI